MPVMTEKQLIMVTFNNNNKFYNMIPNPDGKSFTAIYGRIGTTGNKVTYPAKDWDKIYKSKINKGYEDKTAIMATADMSQTAPVNWKDITNDSIKYIVDMLQSLAKQTVKTNYRISSVQVTPAMIKEAEEILKKLSTETEKVKFNRLLLQLFETIPRKMTNVMSFTARTDDEMGKILQRESDLLDVMKGQVRTNNQINVAADTASASKGTILDALGIEIEECSLKEVEDIKKHLDPDTRKRFKNCWSVRNKKTEINFKNYCEKNHIDKFKFYYHGSRSENWWSIINTGLKLNPTNVVITGKMFGHGIYFAPKAAKSAGYTSMQGAYWTKGTATTGFLAVYKIAYGKPYDVYSFDSKYYQFHEDNIKKIGCDCLHAHEGSMLRNDEVIIYNENAATIRYLIELS